VVPIDEWWPLLDEQIRRWMVNNFWSPVAPYSLAEIARLGGPGEDDPRQSSKMPRTPFPDTGTSVSVLSARGAPFANRRGG
jgi:hypothetical protein